MLIAEKEHERDRIVELVHLFEIGHLVQVADVENREVLHSVGDSCAKRLWGDWVSRGEREREKDR